VHYDSLRLSSVGCLENSRGGNSTGGSNPSLSATSHAFESDSQVHSASVYTFVMVSFLSLLLICYYGPLKLAHRA